MTIMHRIFNVLIFQCKQDVKNKCDHGRTSFSKTVSCIAFTKIHCIVLLVVVIAIKPRVDGLPCSHAEVSR